MLLECVLAEIVTTWLLLCPGFLPGTLSTFNNDLGLNRSTHHSATVVSDGGYRLNRVHNTSQNLRAVALLLRCVVRWWAAW